MASKVIRGADAKVYVNGALLGIVEGWQIAISDGTTEIRGIDNPLPAELAETVYSCTGSLNVYRLRGDGGAEGRGLTALPEKLPHIKYISLRLVDRVTDTPIFESNYVRVNRQQWEIRTKGIMQGQIAWTGIGYVNEIY
jgi:hypothetical protein